MRIALALAGMLLVCAQASAHDVERLCAAQADAKALHGQERVRFETKCRTHKSNVVTPAINRHGEPESPLCAGNFANVFVGACPLCMLLLGFDDDSLCYVR